MVYCLDIAKNVYLFAVTLQEFVLMIATDIYRCKSMKENGYATHFSYRLSHCVPMGTCSPAEWYAAKLDVALSDSDRNVIYNVKYQTHWDEELDIEVTDVTRIKMLVPKAYMFLDEKGRVINPKDFIHEVTDAYYAITAELIAPYSTKNRYSKKTRQGRHRHHGNSYRRTKSLAYYRQMEEYPQLGITADAEAKWLKHTWWDDFYRRTEGNWKSQCKSRNQWGVHKHRAGRETIRRQTDFFDVNFDIEESAVSDSLVDEEMLARLAEEKRRRKRKKKRLEEMFEAIRLAEM